eukprot:tig00020830_g14429.t1
MAEARFRELWQWMQSHGARMERVRPALYEDVGWGLAATERAPELSTLAKLPPRIVLTANKLSADPENWGAPLRAVLDAPFPHDVSMEGTVKWMRIIETEKDRWTLVVFLALNRRRPGCFWAPFIRTLPEHFPFPIYWSWEDLEELRGSAVLPFVIRSRAALRLQHRCSPRIPDRPQPCCISRPRGYLRRELAEPRLAWADFLWAHSVVASRCFLTEVAPCPRATLVLTPGLDLMNHREQPDAFWGTDEDGSFVVTCRADLAAGQQVFTSYGEHKGAATFFTAFGFIPEDAVPAVCITVGGPPPPSALPYPGASVRRLLHTLRAGRIHGELMDAARLRALDEADAAALAARPARPEPEHPRGPGGSDSDESEEAGGVEDEGERPPPGVGFISVRNELAALGYIAQTLQGALNRFATTPEEDAAELARAAPPCPGPPAAPSPSPAGPGSLRLALALRAAEKRLLARRGHLAEADEGPRGRYLREVAGPEAMLRAAEEAEAAMARDPAAAPALAAARAQSHEAADAVERLRGRLAALAAGADPALRAPLAAVCAPRRFLWAHAALCCLAFTVPVCRPGAAAHPAALASAASEWDEDEEEGEEEGEGEEAGGVPGYAHPDVLRAPPASSQAFLAPFLAPAPVGAGRLLATYDSRLGRLAIAKQAEGTLGWRSACGAFAACSPADAEALPANAALLRAAAALAAGAPEASGGLAER